LGVDGLDGPGKGIGDEGDQLLELAAEGGRFPAAVSVGEVEDPDMDAEPGEAHVFVDVVIGA
jgi:hypothetical protein